MDQPVRILYFEEDPADIESAVRELNASQIQCEVRPVCSKESFLKELEAFEPELVLSDYQTASMSGLSLLKQLRLTHKNLPFIFVSWIVHEQSVIEAMRSGATDYVFKDQLSRLSFSVARALREAEEQAELEQAQTKMAQQERLNAFGQMASGIAHDFSNALMPVLGYSELLLNQPSNPSDDKKLRYYLKMMNMAAKDAVNIVSRLQEFYRKRDEVEVFAPVDLNQIVEFTILFTRPKWKDQALSRGAVIRIETGVEKLPKVLGNDTSLREVLTNLIFNAVDAMPKGGSITFRGRLEGDWAVLEVADTGTGMDIPTQEKCFEPFYSTKGKRGTGLGLAMARAIVHRHNGNITVQSERGKGTVFAIRLPVYRSRPQATDSGDVSSVSVTERLHILVLDDDPTVTEIIADYLKADNHKVYTAESLAQALEKYKSRSVDLIVTDWVLQQGVGGHSLIAQIKQVYPNTPVIMMTGFAEFTRVRFQRNESGITLLKKPPTLLAVREAISKSIPNAA